MSTSPTATDYSIQPPQTAAAAATTNTPGSTTMEDVPMEATAANTTSNNKVSNIDDVQNKTGIFGASSNLVNSIVGAGIIGIPYAIDQAGFVVGVLLLITVAYFTDKSLRMIVELASFHPTLRHLGVLTFEDLMRIPFGPRGAHFILASMFILAYGAMVAYLLIIKDSVPTILGLGNTFLEREVVMVITSLISMVPLSMLRDMSSLAFTSALSVTADVVLVGIVLVYAPVRTTVTDHGGIEAVLSDFWISRRLFVGLGVLSTAMACQHSAFLIAGSLEQNTPTRWAAVTGRSLGLAALLSLLLGVWGYLGYLQDTMGDILNNFDPESRAVNGARALLAITMLFTYPMESFVARHVVIQLFFNGSAEHSAGVDANGHSLPEHKWLGCLGRREQITLGLYLVALLPALIVDDLGPVLSLTGSLGASCIAYIAPGLVYLGVHGGDFLDWASGAVRTTNHQNGGAADGGHGDIELPVVGDAAASMQTASYDRATILTKGSKPWWWWIAGMPVWTSIAARGERGTRQFLTNLGAPPSNDQQQQQQQQQPNGDDGVDSIGPNHRDYYVSIVFIVFGVVAAVCGVISNVYIQINNVFFTPR